VEAFGTYKGISSDSQQAVKDGLVREFMTIVLATQVVFLKTKVSLFSIIVFKLLSMVCVALFKAWESETLQ